MRISDFERIQPVVCGNRLNIRNYEMKEIEKEYERHTKESVQICLGECITHLQNGGYVLVEDSDEFDCFFGSQDHSAMLIPHFMMNAIRDDLKSRGYRFHRGTFYPKKQQWIKLDESTFGGEPLDRDFLVNRDSDLLKEVIREIVLTEVEKD